MFEQSQQVIGPCLKVFVDDLSDLWVVGNLRVEGFASNGVDVIDVLMFDGRTHDLGANQTCATCDDDLHVYCLVV
jgi:hypothetical protein